MPDDGKRTRTQLLEEVQELRERVGILESIAAERKQAEDESVRHRVVFHHLEDLAYICDTKGNILTLNKAFEKLTNRKPEEFIGRSFAPLFEGEHLRRATDAYTRTVNGENLQFEIPFKDTGILCEYSNAPLKDESGNIIGVVGIARDVTERRKMEAELQGARDELEAKVEERTAELSSTVLQLEEEITERKQAEEALRESESSLKALVEGVQTAIVVHDGTGKIVLSNQTARKLLEPLATDIDGRKLSDPTWRFFYEDGVEVPVEEYPVSRILETKEAIDGLLLGLRDTRGSEMFWLLVACPP